MRKRYALVGVGSRGYGMFALPLVREFAEVAELVALCDQNRHRMALANAKMGTQIPTYTDYAEMLAATHPDTVIVCTVDATHSRYIVEALLAGCDVISEKPLATRAEDVRAVLQAERASGRRVRVSLNARYGAPAEALRRLAQQHTVGELVAVDFAEYLDTVHGADYFRRWHRRKGNSGGLLIHKASHHFDQLNWWIRAEPEEVRAQGALRFYGPAGFRGDERGPHGERCLDCPYADTCPFSLDLRADPDLRALYLEAESEDGYHRDGCVYDPQIDIEDTLHVLIRYSNGVLVNYALYASMPYEGQRIALNGTKGRMEVELLDRYHGLDEEGRLALRPLPATTGLRVSPLFGRPYTLPVEERGGAHGGADERIRQHLFRDDVPDPLGQQADSRAGALSALVGVAANRSLRTGLPVRIADLL